jgi:hypothetical protein
MTALFGDTFGNYLLHGIEEIHLPEPVAWWPQTPGWIILAGLFLLWCLFRLYLAARIWWHNRYRRAALAQLDKLEQRAAGQYQLVLPALPPLLKATALQAFPRADVAALSGEPWLAFLDRHYDGASFRQGSGRQLLSIAYRPEADWQLSAGEAQQLIAMCRHWLGQHRLDLAAEAPDDA